MNVNPNNKTIAKAFAAATAMGAGLAGGTAILHPDVEKNKKNIAEAAGLGALAGLGVIGLGYIASKSPKLTQMAEETRESIIRRS